MFAFGNLAMFIVHAALIYGTCAWVHAAAAAFVRNDSNRSELDRNTVLLPGN
jgi:hypothetical protein